MYNTLTGEKLIQYKKHDDYMTPNYAWDNIKDYIPKDKKIWEAFYGDGASGNYLRSIGFDVIHEDIDFFKHNKGDVIVSNPPFSQSKKVIERLAELDKPFILIMPSAKITTRYFAKHFGNKGIQILIPPKRINFIKHIDGKVPENWVDRCSFDCFYYAYKMNFAKDIIHL